MRITFPFLRIKKIYRLYLSSRKASAASTGELIRRCRYSRDRQAEINGVLNSARARSRSLYFRGQSSRSAPSRVTVIEFNLSIRIDTRRDFLFHLPCLDTRHRLARTMRAFVHPHISVLLFVIPHSLIKFNDSLAGECTFKRWTLESLIRVSPYIHSADNRNSREPLSVSFFQIETINFIVG